MYGGELNQEICTTVHLLWCRSSSHTAWGGGQGPFLMLKRQSGQATHGMQRVCAELVYGYMCVAVCIHVWMCVLVHV